MTNAIYYLDLVLHEAPENVKEYLGILREQVRVSAKIINDLLDFSRISPAQRQAVPMRTITDAQLANATIPPNVCVEHRVPADLPPAFVDPVHAGQVMLNLVVNAVQAMGPRGNVDDRG